MSKIMLLLSLRIFKMTLCGGLFFILGSCSTDTYKGRWVAWNASGIDDHRKFPFYSFSASRKPTHFAEKYDDKIGALKISTDGSKRRLEELLNESESTAFIVIRQDTIIYEKYLNGYSIDSMNTSFSVAKSITGLMLGKAIELGLISSKQDHVIKYLPELLQVDANYGTLRISHLLDMRSGIRFKDHDLIWGDKPKAYYHPALRERIFELPLESRPGEEFKYNSYNPIVIGMIIERVYDHSPAEFFETYFWDRMGMEYAGSWSLDSEASRMMKMESGLNLRARDFAKFGKLILNKGKWNGEEILSRSWVEDCLLISDEYQVERFSKEIYYHNFWWIFSSHPPDVDIISGWGHLGQYLYVFPKSNIIIVRMGRDNKNIESWASLFKEVESSVRIDQRNNQK